MNRLNYLPRLDNPFLVTSLVVLVYNLINPELFSLGAERVSYYQVFNAINGALTQKWALITGLTAWTPIKVKFLLPI